MSYRLHVLAVAHNDVLETAAFIERDSPDAALRFLDSIEDTLAKILAHPRTCPFFANQAGPIEGLRRCSVIGFPALSVFYRIDGGVVYVVRVFHGARDLPAVLSDQPDS